VDQAAIDRRWMRRVLLLARRQAGATWPNPTVACCMVRDGQLLAEAVHAGPGEPHAEASVLLALAAHRIDPSGATAYVNLEPCHHEGRTAPCSVALADAGVARGVFATADDTPRHPGGGGEWLSRRGVEVVDGVLGDLARELNHPFLETGADDDPHLTLKLALTADGCVARRPGRVGDAAGRAITGERVRRRVHRIRAGASAVVIGAGTARADQPRLDVRCLTPRQWSGKAPLPVVLAGSGSLSAEALPPGSLVFGTAGQPGMEPVAACSDGRPNWDNVLSELVARGRGIVLVEGGSAVAADLLAKRPPHRIHLYLAGRGFGPSGVKLPGGIGLDDGYQTLRVRRVGPDVEWVLRRRDLG
jgi:diaminohydroxyphosphoribosylaminopyrimidine deaminase/5-amino-6-(5-phosphoribosylamino)uracil reductase